MRMKEMEVVQRKKYVEIEHTFRAGLTAVSWKEDWVVTVRLWAVLLNVLTVHLAKHLAPTALLLEEKHEVYSLLLLFLFMFRHNKA